MKMALFFHFKSPIKNTLAVQTFFNSTKLLALYPGTYGAKLEAVNRQSQTICVWTNTFQFLLNDNTQLNLNKINAKDFYWLFIDGSTRCHTGPMKWSRSLSVSDNDWQTIF